MNITSSDNHEEEHSDTDSSVGISVFESQKGKQHHLLFRPWGEDKAYFYKNISAYPTFLDENRQKSVFECC